MKTIKLAIMAVAGVIALSEGSALAVVELSLDQQSIKYSASSGTVGLSYNEFNPSLGQLVSVSISLNTYNTALSEVFSPASPGVPYSCASASFGTETVNALGLSTLTGPLSAGPFAGTTAGWLTIAGSGRTEHVTASEMVLPANFASFIGTGSAPFNVTVLSDTGTYSGNGPGSLVGFGGAVSSCGTIEIDYDYIANAVAVPEARASSIFAGGFAVFIAIAGLILRTRRSVT